MLVTISIHRSLRGAETKNVADFGGRKLLQLHTSLPLLYSVEPPLRPGGGGPTRLCMRKHRYRPQSSTKRPGGTLRTSYRGSRLLPSVLLPNGFLASLL